jgi:tetratricopeptide (TPR) repeat protein
MNRPRMPSAVLLAALVLASASCSSAPAKSDTVTTAKQAAADAAVSGEQYFHQGRYDLALQFFTQALDANASVDNVDGVVRSRISIAQVYLAEGRMDAAQVMLSGAREQARTGRLSLFVDSSISLGELSLRKEDPHTALRVLQEALDAGGTQMTPEQAGVLYHDIGAAWKMAGDMVKALEWLSRSLEGNLAHKLFEQAAADYYVIASVRSKQGDFPGAVRSAQLALGLDKQVESSLGIAEDLSALGLIESKSGDPAAAYDYFQRAYGVYAALGAKGGMQKSLNALISIAESLGRTDEAHDYRQALERTGAQ